MGEAYYIKLQLPVHHVNVRSATESNLVPVGQVRCTFLLGNAPFEYDFTVCTHLTRPFIIGRDFLVQNHIAVRYSGLGKCILDHKHNMN